MALKTKLRLSALKAIRWGKSKEKNDVENSKPSNLKRSRSATTNPRKSWIYSGSLVRGKSKGNCCNSSGESFTSGLDQEDSGSQQTTRLKCKYSRNSLRLKELLEDKEALEAFTRFCQSQYAAENLMFWLQAEKFRQFIGLETENAKIETSRKAVVKQALEVYNRFLKSDADDWVCVQTETINRIASNLAKEAEKVDTNLFLKAQEETLRTVESDLIPRFIKSAVVGSDFEINGKLRHNLQELLHKSPCVVAVD